MKRFFFMVLAVTMLAIPMAGCSGGDSLDCGDVAKKACAKLYDCNYTLNVNGSPVTEAGCVTFVTNQLSGTSDQECRDEWNVGEDLDCSAYDDWWNEQ